MKPPVCPKTSVGGQAVIEGVMMRSPKRFAVAVRDPKGAIVVRDQPWRSLGEKLPFLRWPFFRGTVVLVESMANGMSALAYSAKIAATAEEPPAAAASDARPPAKPAAKGEEFSFGWVLVVTLALTLLIFKGVPHLVALGLDALWHGAGTQGLLFHAVDGAVKLSLFAGYLLLIGRMKDIQRVFAYHGAEHQAIATFEAGEALTVENARRHSRFHPRCGTAFLLIVILVGVLLYMLLLPFLPPLVAGYWLNQILLVLLKIVLLLPIAGLSYEVIRLSGKFQTNPLVRLLTQPGMWMQRLVTREPSDDQLEIALVSIETALARMADAPQAVSRPGEPDVREAVFENFAAFRAGLAPEGG